MAVWLTGIRCTSPGCTWTYPNDVKAGDPSLAAAFNQHISDVQSGASPAGPPVNVGPPPGPSPTHNPPPAPGPPPPPPAPHAMVAAAAAPAGPSAATVANHHLYITSREARGAIVGAKCPCGVSMPNGTYQWSDVLAFFSDHPHGAVLEIMLLEPGDAEPSSTFRSKAWVP